MVALGISSRNLGIGYMIPSNFAKLINTSKDIYKLSKSIKGYL
jgi:hypothetical protein